MDKIEPTIKPEIRQQNERQKEEMRRNHLEYKKIIDKSHANNFGKMLEESMEKKS